MTERDVRTKLFDALQVATDARLDLGDTTIEAFLANRPLRMAIYWQVMTVGEALNQAARVDARPRDQVPNFIQIIATRNRLVHAYGEINDTLIWAVVRDRLPDLAIWLASYLDDNPLNGSTSS